MARPRSYGWRTDKEDSAYLRDDATAVRFSLGEFAAPPIVDPRDWLQVENQGSVGACAGFARTTAMELAVKWATGQVVQFSTMFSYLTAQKEDGLIGRDQGSSITGNMRAARKYGNCFEATFPFPGRYTTKIPQAAIDEGTEHQLRAHAYCSNYDDVFRFIAGLLGGVQIGVPWNNSWTPDASGRIERVSLNSRGGGHSVAFVGYTATRDSDGRQYLIVANSWSKSWGAGGFAEVAPSVVDAIGAARGRTEMIGLSDLEGFDEPRPTDWSKVV